MATTTELKVTKTWQQASLGNAVLQARTSPLVFQIHVGDVMPAANAPSLETELTEPLSLVFGSGVYVRLRFDAVRATEQLIVIQ